MTATVDIFMPYWGDPDYARQTVDSVLAQRNDAWRLTVVDDAYPGTELAQYIASLSDSRVRYVRKKVNAGITENFRTCVASARLPLTVVVGCDDRLLPNYVDEIVRAHQLYPTAAIIQPGVEVIDQTGSVVRPLVDRVKTELIKPKGDGYRLLGGERLAGNLLTGDWLYWPSLAFRTERVQQYSFREGFPVTQDLALIMDMVFAGEQLVTFDEVCFQYRRHARSASSVELSDGRRFAAEREYFALAAQLADDRGWKRATRAARARLTSRAHALTLVPGAVTHGAFSSALIFLRHGLGG